MRTTNSLLSGLTGGLSPAVFIVLVIGVLTNVVSTADNSTGNGGDTKPKTAMEKGLEPVYVMTNYFMDLVQPDNPASSPIIGEYTTSRSLRSQLLWFQDGGIQSRLRLEVNIGRQE